MVALAVHGHIVNSALPCRKLCMLLFDVLFAANNPLETSPVLLSENMYVNPIAP